MIKAYRNLPLSPRHKAYVASMWRGHIWINHCAMEGLATSGNIQGSPTDALIAILRSKSIQVVMEWVDDLVFFHTPTHMTDTTYHYLYDITSVKAISDLLGIPWHPFETKGQDFGLTVQYVGFLWNLREHSVSLPKKKRQKYLAKVSVFIASAPD